MLFQGAKNLQNNNVSAPTKIDVLRNVKLLGNGNFDYTGESVNKFGIKLANFENYKIFLYSNQNGFWRNPPGSAVCAQNCRSSMPIAPIVT